MLPGGTGKYRESEVMAPWNTGQALPGWTTLIKVSEGIQLTVSITPEPTKS